MSEMANDSSPGEQSSPIEPGDTGNVDPAESSAAESAPDAPVSVAWDAYVRASQARRDVQAEVLNAVVSRWSAGAPHAGSPSWMTALVERLHRVQTDEQAAHDAWLRHYCRQVRSRLKSA